MSGSPIAAFVSFQPFRVAAVTSGAAGYLVPAWTGHRSRHLQGKTALDSTCSCSVFFFLEDKLKLLSTACDRAFS